MDPDLIFTREAVDMEISLSVFQMRLMLHSCANGIIIYTSFLVRNWPCKASLRLFMFNFRLANSYLR